MLVIAYMSIEGMNDANREVLYSCVAPERREQLRARKNRTSADLSLAGEALARVMLCQMVRQLEIERKDSCDCIPDDFPYSGGMSGVIQPKDFVIAKDENGKPYQETVPGLFFNISHSGTMVACGMAGENIGVDIQKRTDGVKVSKKVLCPEEMEEERCREKAGTADLSCCFTEIWTRKESYLKLTGEGLRKAMTSLHVRKMQEDGECQWFGGWVTEEYCLYACVEGVVVKGAAGKEACGAERKTKDCITTDASEAKQDARAKENGCQICRISLKEIVECIRENDM